MKHPVDALEEATAGPQCPGIPPPGSLLEQRGMGRQSSVCSPEPCVSPVRLYPPGLSGAGPTAKLRSSLLSTTPPAIGQHRQEVDVLLPGGTSQTAESKSLSAQQEANLAMASARTADVTCSLPVHGATDDLAVSGLLDGLTATCATMADAALPDAPVAQAGIVTKSYVVSQRSSRRRRLTLSSMASCASCKWEARLGRVRVESNGHSGVPPTTEPRWPHTR